MVVVLSNWISLLNQSSHLSTVTALSWSRWLQSLPYEHLEWGRNTPWIGCHRIAHNSHLGVISISQSTYQHVFWGGKKLENSEETLTDTYRIVWNSTQTVTRTQDWTRDLGAMGALAVPVLPFAWSKGTTELTTTNSLTYIVFLYPQYFRRWKFSNLETFHHNETNAQDW